MKRNKPTKLLLIWLFAFPVIGHSQVSNDSAVLINDLSAFSNPEKTWSTVRDVIVNPVGTASFKKTAGSEILLADAAKTETYLTTQTSFGDIEMEFDFLVGRGTVSAVLLQGRYRLNLSDSWAQLTPSSKNMGGIGQQNIQDFSGFSGSLPLMNVAKAPGLWQHVKLRFRSPQFLNGAKTTNAVFEEVYINGCLVQQNVELQGPSAGATLTTEAASAPVVFYAGNGIFALKNLFIRKLPAANDRPQTGRRFRPVNPIVITPEGSNYLLRSFLNFGNKKKNAYHFCRQSKGGELLL